MVMTLILTTRYDFRGQSFLTSYTHNHYEFWADKDIHRGYVVYGSYGKHRGFWKSCSLARGFSGSYVASGHFHHNAHRRDSEEVYL